jgi:hypothetical protein
MHHGEMGDSQAAVCVGGEGLSWLGDPGQSLMRGLLECGSPRGWGRALD